MHMGVERSLSAPVEEEIARCAIAFLKKGLGVNQDRRGHRVPLDPWDCQDPQEFQERKG